MIESDVLHRVCPPSRGSGGAGKRLRFSLVLKLALCPRSRQRRRVQGAGLNVLSRPWWGPPADFGSARALSELVRRVGEERKSEQTKRKPEDGGGEEKEGEEEEEREGEEEEEKEGARTAT